MLSERVRAWQEQGEIREICGHSLFVHEQEGDGPRLVFLHGYPSSSYDWREVIARLPSQALTAFDFLGFGLSAKPRDQRYSLLMQADLAEAVMATHTGEEIVIVAHDMGTSVATELLARSLEGRLAADVRAALLFNGSLVLEKASLTISQKVLRSRLGPLAARLSNERSFRLQFARIFSDEHPLSSDEAADQWGLLAHEGGHRILDRLIFYLHERIAYAERWHGALRDWPGALELAWADRDPICTEAVLQAVLALRPAIPLTRLPGLGHYPQIEDPAALTRVVRRLAGRPAASDARRSRPTPGAQDTRANSSPRTATPAE